MLTEIETKNREYVKNNKPLAYKKIMKYDGQIASGKSIAMLQIHPSYACNFHCNHCSISCFREQKLPTMTLEDIKRICNEADEYGLAQIDLAGGEPLVYKNIWQILKAIGTQRFYLSIATNGWFLTKETAAKLKQYGADRIALSLDSLNEKEHDELRNKEGSWKKAIEAIKNTNDIGLNLKISSVITHNRVRTEEFKDFMAFIKNNNATLLAQPARAVGEWEGRNDITLTKDDIKYLEENYNIQFHTSTHFGMNLGCLAVKKCLLVTAFGDVMPCLFMYKPIGNVLKDSLKDIIEKGMKTYGKFHKNCRLQKG